MVLLSICLNYTISVLKLNVFEDRKISYAYNIKIDDSFVFYILMYIKLHDFSSPKNLNLETKCA